MKFFKFCKNGFFFLSCWLSFFSPVSRLVSVYENGYGRSPLTRMAGVYWHEIHASRALLSKRQRPLPPPPAACDKNSCVCNSGFGNVARAQLRPACGRQLAVPPPAIHSILTGLQVGEAVYQTGELPKIPSNTLRTTSNTLEIHYELPKAV